MALLRDESGGKGLLTTAIISYSILLPLTPLKPPSPVVTERGDSYS